MTLLSATQFQILHIPTFPSYLTHQPVSAVPPGIDRSTPHPAIHTRLGLGVNDVQQHDSRKHTTLELPSSDTR
jgi:hypothetical protein